LSSVNKYFTKLLTNLNINYIITLSVPRLKHIYMVILTVINLQTSKPCQEIMKSLVSGKIYLTL